MTNEQFVEKLKKLYDCKTEFTVTQTGKINTKENGSYNPKTHEILLHNRNFTTTNELMYTAIHELTHHILTTEKGIKTPKCHSGIFWASFYNLLDKAIELSMYERTRSEETQKLIAQAKAIEQEIIEAEKRLGRIIRQIFESCETHHERNEDVLEHDLQMTRARALSLVNKSLSDNNNSADIAQSIARASNAEQKIAAQQAAIEGKTPAQVKAIAQQKPQMSDDDIQSSAKLEKEKQRLQQTIAKLTVRLEQIEEQLQSIEGIA